MSFRHKGLTEILAARKRVMKWKQHYPREVKPAFNPEEEASEGKIDYYAKKEELSNEDKLEVLHQLQKRYRIVFTNRFPIDRVKWISVPIAKLLDKVYDSNKKSYYLLRGKVIISREGYNDEVLQGQRGIGLLFSGQTIKKCSLTAQNALLLQISHSSEDLVAIERNSLLTTREKYQAIRSFKLFEHVDNIQKNYLTFITAVKYTKGDYIYKRGDITNRFYLIVQGQVSFQTTIEGQQSSSCSQSLIELIRIKKREESHLVTEVLTEGSYFGEEEIIDNCCRLQSAKCSSISCLLLVVPIDKVIKLMEIPQFRQSLESSSNQREAQRNRKLSSFEHLRLKTPDKGNSTEPSQHFQLFKTKMFKFFGGEKEESIKKMSLNSQKHKVMHGHSFKVGRRACETEPIEFSMLEVNEQTYSKTIKRFRRSLQQINRQKQPKSKIEIGQARSLEKYWHVLHLQSVFDPQHLNPFIKVHHQEVNGRENYQVYSRLMKNVKHTHSIRPKGATTSCRLKQEYIKYLQNLS